MDTIAIHQVAVRYEGHEAHAAAHPELGLNALDAAVLGYVNVAALRQHIGPNERIHGIFTDGGAKPNIVPAHAAALWYVRSPSLATLEPLKDRVLACLDAGARASGCSMHAEWNDPPYADMLDNPSMVAAFQANAAAVGRQHRHPDARSHVVGSTDMGNVSYLAPSIHPMIRVAPPGVSIHTAEFTRYAGGAEGDAAVIDGAIAMAATVVDLWADESLRRAAAEEHRTATQGDHPPVM
jgi:metal-dependent amidase/aminoacylase/carboxypeptidase family protein